MTRGASVALLVPFSFAACIHGAPPAPAPGESAEVSVLSAVVRRFRAHPPHRGLPLAVAPATVGYQPDRYPIALRVEFAAAVADLDAKRGRVDPIGPPYLAGVPVRRAGVYDPYELEQYLLIRLSPVGFSADSGRAALVVVFDCGPGCGSHVGLGLRRARNGGWRIAQAVRIPLPPVADTAGTTPS